MRGLILASGKGSRLKSVGEIKPLVKVLGVPLIERVIRSAMEGGVDDFVVVTGYRAEEVNRFLGQLSKRLGVSISIVQNDQWEKENGFSLLKARDVIDEPFVLLMSDHIFSPGIVRRLRDRFSKGADVLLAVDTNIRNPFIDIDDVTKVFCEDGYIRDIGKKIKEFNGFDTGIFLCTPAIFDAVERVHKMHNDTTLSAAVRVLAEKSKAKCVSISDDDFWIDVDDENAYKKAQELLLNSLEGKRNDGPVSRLLNRPISTRISRLLLDYDITPNQVSFFSFLLSLVVAWLFSLGSYPALAMGGIIAQVASIIDGCDGEIARLKYLSSDYGAWFDAVLDRYADAFLLFGLTWHVYSKSFFPQSIVVGFLAIIGSFMVSYTADKYDKFMKNRFGRGFRIGRDIRIFLIFLGALLNQAYLVLIVIAVFMNLEAIRRIIVCRHE